MRLLSFRAAGVTAPAHKPSRSHADRARAVTDKEYRGLYNVVNRGTDVSQGPLQNAKGLR